jgi:hypothetical protein
MLTNYLSDREHATRRNWTYSVVNALAQRGYHPHTCRQAAQWILECGHGRVVLCPFIAPEDREDIQTIMDDDSKGGA